MVKKNIIELTLPLTDDAMAKLRCGHIVYLSGLIYTARDAAHKKMMEALERGQDLPIPMEGAAIYYAGPSPIPPGKVIGSIGPTTAGRMDDMTIPLLAQGLKIMIGKGERSPQVMEEMKRHGAIYLAAVGGAGALISKTVKAQRIVAYEDLGAEAIRELIVDKMPLIVAIDTYGRSLYRR